MLTLYHAPTTRSFRIKWLLAELDVPYKQNIYDFYNMERHDPEYRKINSIGSFPSIEEAGLILTESGSIINYVLRKHGKGRFMPSPSSRDEALVDEWMYWAEGLFAVHQRIFWDHCAQPPGCIINPVPSVGEEAKRQAIKYAGMLERALNDGGFVVGNDLTGADFMLSFPLYLANLSGWFAEMPRITAYVKRFSARPAFQSAIADTLEYFNDRLTKKPEFPSYRSTESLITA